MPAPTNERRDKARNLRKNTPPTERKLWARLRRSALGYRFRRQHAIGDYIADFACVKIRVVVEVDGASHFDKPSDQAYDEKRTAFLRENGWTVLRLTNTEVTSDIDAACDAVRQACDEAALRPR